jgi:hypothetical protein
MSKPSLPYVVGRCLGPLLVTEPCAHCNGPIVEDGQGPHGETLWACLHCNRPPGSPRPHEEPDSLYAERLTRAHHAAKANAYWAQHAEAS